CPPDARASSRRSAASTRRPAVPAPSREVIAASRRISSTSSAATCGTGTTGARGQPLVQTPRSEGALP
ncbi:MAG: hypothetical protein AVDCRST_MAG40-690, partial [uncultured Gemmatimonadaceae bacterium]